MKKFVALFVSLLFILASLSSVMTANAAELDAYTSAKEGDVVFTANFHGIPGEYEPGLFSGTPEVTPSADGSSMTIKTTKDKSASYWGGFVESLPLNETTCYTIYYTVTRTSIDSIGVYFDSVYGAYGYPERTRIMNKGSSLAGHDYVNYANAGLDVTVTEPVVQEFALEVNGVNNAFSHYIKDGKGEFVLVDESGYDGVPYFNSDVLGLFFYIYYSAHSATVSNCYVVKGLSFGTYEVPETTEAPVTTTAPVTEAPKTTDAPTTDAPTTDAPTTDAPATDAPTTDAPTTDAPKAEGGCGGAVFSGLAIVSAVAAGAVLIKKKRK